MIERLANVYNDFVRGQPVMYLIVLCSWIALAVFVERGLAYIRWRPGRGGFLRELREALARKRVVEALALCDRFDTPASRVVRVGLLSHDRPPSEIRTVMEDAARRELSELERYLPMLSTIVVVTPLLGLLGTVSGLMQAFRAIASETSFVSPSLVAGGVWTALSTTAAGLGVAIPSLVVYNFLSTRAASLAAAMEGLIADVAQALETRGT